MLSLLKKVERYDPSSVNFYSCAISRGYFTGANSFCGMSKQCNNRDINALCSAEEWIINVLHRGMQVLSPI